MHTYQDTTPPTEQKEIIYSSSQSLVWPAYTVENTECWIRKSHKDINQEMIKPK
jgi:hypothetical protein